MKYPIDLFPKCQKTLYIQAFEEDLYVWLKQLPNANLYTKQ